MHAIPTMKRMHLPSPEFGTEVALDLFVQLCGEVNPIYCAGRDPRT